VAIALSGLKTQNEEYLKMKDILSYLTLILVGVFFLGLMFYVLFASLFSNPKKKNKEFNKAKNDTQLNPKIKKRFVGRT